MINIKDQLVIGKEVLIVNDILKGLRGELVGAHSESFIVVVRVDGIDFQLFRSDIVQE